MDRGFGGGGGGFWAVCCFEGIDNLGFRGRILSQREHREREREILLEGLRVKEYPVGVLQAIAGHPHGVVRDVGFEVPWHY